ncbi:MAG: ribose 5-phosphate isomerase B [Clostridia bacterium]|nr:ribose 5-phosphate isomerase B [Clostridia bacterium]MBP5270373.1 ribose 5-phosphate isomerase B [Clostridia bacterium]
MIAIGSDHAGPDIKSRLADHLKESGFSVIDLGTFSADSCDYPVYAEKVCHAVSSGMAEAGILICGTGIGMSICANKHRGIVAAHCTDVFSAKMAREHNGANVICMGARISDYTSIENMTDVFLSSDPLDEEKHKRRRGMIADLDELIDPLGIGQ